jgi:hypothetical protein
MKAEREGARCARHGSGQGHPGIKVIKNQEAAGCK